MICPICGGNVYTDWACGGCGITYAEMIGDIRHDDMRKLIAKNHLEESDELLLVGELKKSSFLLFTSPSDNHLQVMTVSDRQNRNYILLFTDKDEYDENNMGGNPTTNPFDLVLDLLDDRFEGFVINIDSEAFELNRKFLSKHFLGA